MTRFEFPGRKTLIGQRGKMRQKIYGGSHTCILCRTGSATGNDTTRALVVKIAASKLDFDIVCDRIQDEMSLWMTFRVRDGC